MIGDLADDKDFMELLLWDSGEVRRKKETEEQEGIRKEKQETNFSSHLITETIPHGNSFSSCSHNRAIDVSDGRPRPTATREGDPSLPVLDTDLSLFSIDSPLHTSNTTTGAVTELSGGGQGTYSPRTLKLPEELHAALYPHQLEGVQWLFQRHCYARCALLADEMGLGKTVQVCAFLGQMYRERRIQSSIVVVPVTLISFWVEMLSRWGGLHLTTTTSAASLSPSSGSDIFSQDKVGVQKEKKREKSGPYAASTSARSFFSTTSSSTDCIGDGIVLVIQGGNKAKRASKWRRVALCSSKPASSSNPSFFLVLTSYSVIRQDVPTVPALRNSVVDYIILDESHQIKDSTSSVCQSVLELSARHRLALSGTPVMNSFEDMWSLFLFLDGGRTMANTLPPTAAPSVILPHTRDDTGGEDSLLDTTIPTDSSTAPSSSSNSTHSLGKNGSSSKEGKTKGKSISSLSPSRAAFRAISRSILRGNERDATAVERRTADEELSQLQAVMNTFSLRREKHLIWPETGPCLRSEMNATDSHEKRLPVSGKPTHMSNPTSTLDCSSSTYASSTSKGDALSMKAVNCGTTSSLLPAVSSGAGPTSNLSQNPFACKKYDMVVWIALTDIQRKQYDTVLDIKAEAVIRGMERKKKSAQDRHRFIRGFTALPPPLNFSEDVDEEEKADHLPREGWMEGKAHTDDGTTIIPVQEAERDTEKDEKGSGGNNRLLEATAPSAASTSLSLSSPQPEKSEGGALGLLSLLRDVCQHPWLHLREDSFSTALCHLHTPPCVDLGSVESGSKLIVAMRLIKQHLFPAHLGDANKRNKEEGEGIERNENENNVKHRFNGFMPKQKVLVFSQSKRMLRLLGALLEEEKIPFLRLDGEVKPEQRGVLVDWFNKVDEKEVEVKHKEGTTVESRETRKGDLSPPAHSSLLYSMMKNEVEHLSLSSPLPSSSSFSCSSSPSASPSPLRPSPLVALLSTQVGGTGLTFNTASCVILLDPSWNPAVDNQCVDRVHRIGQKSDQVFVYRLITCGTVEEKMYRNQIFKMTAAMQSVRQLPRSFSFSGKEEYPVSSATSRATTAKSRWDTKDVDSLPVNLQGNKEERREGGLDVSSAKQENERTTEDSSPLASPLVAKSRVDEEDKEEEEEDEEPLLLHSGVFLSPSQEKLPEGQRRAAGVKRSRSQPHDHTSIDPGKGSLSGPSSQRERKAQKVYNYFTRIQLRNMFARGEYERSETAIHIENFDPFPLSPTSSSWPSDDVLSLSGVEKREEEEGEEQQQQRERGGMSRTWNEEEGQGGIRVPSRRGVLPSLQRALLKIPHVVDVNSNDPAILFWEEVAKK